MFHLLHLRALQCLRAHWLWRTRNMMLKPDSGDLSLNFVLEAQAKDSRKISGHLHFWWGTAIRILYVQGARRSTLADHGRSRKLEDAGSSGYPMFAYRNPNENLIRIYGQFLPGVIGWAPESSLSLLQIPDSTLLLLASIQHSLHKRVAQLDNSVDCISTWGWLCNSLSIHTASNGQLKTSIASCRNKTSKGQTTDFAGCMMKGQNKEELVHNIREVCDSSRSILYVFKFQSEADDKLHELHVPFREFMIGAFWDCSRDLWPPLIKPNEEMYTFM